MLNKKCTSFQVVNPFPEIATILREKLKKNGIHRNGCVSDDDDGHYPCVVIEKGSKTWSYSGNHYNNTKLSWRSYDITHQNISLSEFNDLLEWLADKPIEVKLNDATTAEVTKTCVRVKGQEIGFERIREVKKAIDGICKSKFNYYVDCSIPEVTAIIHDKLITAGLHPLNTKDHCQGSIGIYINEFEFSYSLYGWDREDKGKFCQVLSIEKFFKVLPDIKTQKLQKINLTPSWNAMINKNNITVNCQTFDFNAVDRLLAAIDEKIA